MASSLAGVPAWPRGPLTARAGAGGTLRGAYTRRALGPRRRLRGWSHRSAHPRAALRLAHMRYGSAHPTGSAHSCCALRRTAAPVHGSIVGHGAVLRCPASHGTTGGATAGSRPGGQAFHPDQGPQRRGLAGTADTSHHGLRGQRAPRHDPDIQLLHAGSMAGCLSGHGNRADRSAPQARIVPVVGRSVRRPFVALRSDLRSPSRRASLGELPAELAPVALEAEERQSFYRTSVFAATSRTHVQTWPLSTSVAWSVHFPAGSFRASGSVRLARPRGAIRLPEYWGTRRPAGSSTSTRTTCTAAGDPSRDRR